MRAIALLLLALTSCATIRKAEQLIEQGQQLVQKADVSVTTVNQTLTGLQIAASAMGEKGKSLVAKAGEVRALVKRSDLNSDGRVQGFGEWKELLYGLVLLVVGWFTKRGVETKLEKQVEKVDDRLTRGKRDLHGRIDGLPNGGDSGSGS